MRLEKVLNLNSKLSVELLQKAYEIVIKKIFLMQSMYPVKISETAYIPELNDSRGYSTILNESEFAWKEIKTLFPCEIVSETSKDLSNSLLPIEIGNMRDVQYGFDLDHVNNLRTENPCLYWSNRTLACDNIDGDTFFMMSGYQYPYPVITSTASPFTDKHTYRIQDMIDTHGVENLYMDNLLVPLICTQAISLFLYEQGDVQGSFYDDMCKKYINLYNSNKESLTPSLYSSVETLKGSL